MKTGTKWGDTRRDRPPVEQPTDPVARAWWLLAALGRGLDEGPAAARGGNR